MSEPTPSLTLGPPRYFVPVCVRRPLGFSGGPVGYEERPAGDLGECPIVLDKAAEAEEATDEQRR